ncbi:MAG: hypothetical protein KBC56_08145, partial [Flavobacterium sp.]|nr:hypothetical protein [Flavobacterium sp.]
TEPLDIDDGIFYETPEVYTIANGQHEMVDHVLTETFNCFSFGNGAESYQIRDAFNEKYISIDFCPTAVSEDQYRQVRRFADITYSEIYNSNTNVNKLNEFNLFFGNFKDDIEKGYGSIQKIKGIDTNLDLYQEDQVSVVYYGKDILSNADGTTNLISIPEVLGKVRTYEGEYGISSNPSSYDIYGFNSYCSDIKRGVWIKKSNNGLFEISFQGMRDYWKTMFKRTDISEILGAYDQFNDYFIANVKFNDGSFVTWVYSDINNGWLGRLSFNPEGMCRINNELISFQNGEVYLHNQTSVYNTFYGVESPSKFSFVFSQEPSTRKNFKTFEVEGDVPVQVSLKTDFNDGYVNVADFEKEENVWRSYTRVSNGAIDTSLLSTQGIGNVTNIAGNVLQFGFDLDTIISNGDEVYNQNMQLVGTITGKTLRELTLNSVANLNNGDYCLCVKPQSVENNGLLGTFMKVDCEFSATTPKEIYAISSEVAKSFT